MSWPGLSGPAQAAVRAGVDVSPRSRGEWPEGPRGGIETSSPLRQLR
ncbi:hypothetical protein X907_0942 [Glycocaulis alkaliphilus]|uniref:Uncharacterized protein n=1 Tax=Glycocaulis alkaliphilus TaxID=1434191 RepID=A0A3T0E827_9PROT|nr:hypothetical protein X907_0942 [Glycocaulis alkaliphilus]